MPNAGYCHDCQVRLARRGCCARGHRASGERLVRQRHGRRCAPDGAGSLTGGVTRARRHSRPRAGAPARAPVAAHRLRSPARDLMAMLAAFAQYPGYTVAMGHRHRHDDRQQGRRRLHGHGQEAGRLRGRPQGGRGGAAPSTSGRCSRRRASGLSFGDVRDRELLDLRRQALGHEEGGRSSAPGGRRPGSGTTARRAQIVEDVAARHGFDGQGRPGAGTPRPW